MLRAPEERELALECLRLAARYSHGVPCAEILADAERYYAFASGDDASDRLEAVRAAVAK